eukprot:TRINITY_DN1622_c0_g2_i1.p1 TRINITY_DN1622_c0_g2~~TRINITY_DN1622_c0_g2_i1.p1  ORF type:complete len:379 (-),score=82.79 TRINITY_DN1622_c0_g2_i1:42-1178(-)
MSGLCDQYFSECSAFNVAPRDYLIKIFDDLDTKAVDFDELNLKGNQDVFYKNRFESIEIVMLMQFLTKVSAQFTFKKLDLSFNNIDDTGMIAIGQYLVKADNLLYLDVSHNNATPKCTREFAQSFKGSNIQYLDISDNDWGDDLGEVLSPALMLCPSLKVLKISNVNLSDTSIILLSHGLRELKELQQLELRYPKLKSLDNEAIIHLCSLLKNNSNIMELDLGGWRINDSVIQVFCEYINFMNLRALSLCKNEISTSGCEFLFNSLLNVKSLVYLDLSSNRINDKSCLPIGTYLTHPNCTLEILKLNNNRILSDGLLLLAGGIQRCRTLKMIWLWGAKFDHTAALAIETVLQQGVVDSDLTFYTGPSQNNRQVAVKFR